MLLFFASMAQAGQVFDGSQWFVGDLHAHSAYSGDAASAESGTCWGDCGAMSDLVQTAKDNGLDFLAVTDHTNGNMSQRLPQADPADYEALLATMDAANDEAGGFVTIPAAEVWFQLVGGPDNALGHKSLLLFGTSDQLYGFSEADTWPGGSVNFANLTSCTQISDWMTDLTAVYGPALLIPHHPGAVIPMPTDWSCYDPTWSPAVEVYSVHGSSLGDVIDFDPQGQGSVSEGLVSTALDPDGYGLKMGFVAGTDRHDTRPGEVCEVDQSNTHHVYGGGLTMVALPEKESFTRGAIHDAIVAHHTLASSGPVLPVSIAWSYADGAWPLGGLGDDPTIPVGAPLTVEVSVPEADADGVMQVALAGPGGVWWELDPGQAGTWTLTLPADLVEAYFYVDVVVDGDTWWGAAGCDDGGDTGEEHVWSSPSWFTIGPADADEDGYTTETDCDDTRANVYPGASELWYDGIDENCDGADDFDRDGDGWPRGEDCSDRSPRSYPGAPGWTMDCVRLTP